MLKPLLFLVELARILGILVLGGTLLWMVELTVYNQVGLDGPSYAGVAAIANLLLVFVLYRNVLQFNGWYKSERAAKLPYAATLSILVLSGILLIVIPMATEIGL